MRINPVVALGLLLSVQAGSSFVATNARINHVPTVHKAKVFCMCDRGYAQPSKTERWQDLAEFLINPLKSPLEKPAVLQKLFSRSEDIADSVSGVLSGKVCSGALDVRLLAFRKALKNVWRGNRSNRKTVS